MDLTKKKCEPCEGGVAPLTEEEIKAYQSYLKVPWEVTSDNKEISKSFKFQDFVENIKFVNKVADIAEEEGHHPDMEISYSRLKIRLSTHAIDGLSTNDFILASKIDKLQE